jgi:DNA repair exonuclease SbcCD nuclease subunit
MVKFSHLADCHLGGWRQEELQNLNLASFRKAIDISIEERVDFVLIAGDLFDSAYPPIEILKETFAEFKKLKDVGIKVYLIAGSHDFSASGKTFLDVLEKAGFCENVQKFELEESGKIELKPSFFKDIAIFGYSGKKSGMEIEDLKKIYIDSIYPFSILMIHTTIKDVVGSIPMESIDKLSLPVANYYAMGHIHQIFKKEERNSVFVYPGPIFPNNFQELTDLGNGSFEMVELDKGLLKSRNIKLDIVEKVFLSISLDNGLTATEKIITEIDKLNLKDKLFLLKLTGTLNKGKSGDIRFNEIEEFVKKKGAFSFLRNISSITNQEEELEIDVKEIDNLEEKIFSDYSLKNPHDFNKFLPNLLKTLSLEKNEDEKISIFENRLLSEIKSALSLEGII